MKNNPFNSCLLCGSAHDCQISKTLELSNSALFDDNRISGLNCQHCHFYCLIHYMESRRGTLDQDISRHVLYAFESAQYKNMIKDINQCPKPDHAACSCATHKIFNEFIESGHHVLIQSCTPYAIIDITDDQHHVMDLKDLDIPFHELRLEWLRINNIYKPYHIKLFDRAFDLTLGDFPETALYSITNQNDLTLGSFDDWPDNFVKRESPHD